MTLADEIARTLDAPPALLPYLPELFADLEELGGNVTDTLEVLRPLRLPRGSSVLDLGCGKGAVSVALARELGCRVAGIDAMPAFVEHARRRATELGVDHLCRFECDDVRAAAARERGFDAVLLLAVGRPWGTLAASVGALRGAARPGGWLLIDDAYLADRPQRDVTQRDVTQWEGYADHATSMQDLQAHGDRVVQELGETPASAAFLRDSFPLFEARARVLAAKRPDLAPLIDEFLALQRSETEALHGDLVPALWLLQRGP